jgi:hypothetical protein
MYVWVSGEVDPCIWVILDHRDLTCPPVKKIVFEGLYIPPSTLSRQQSCPLAHCWEEGYMPPYRLSGTETGHPLKEEGAQDSTKPKFLIGTLPTLCKLSLHAYKHGSTPVKNGGLQALNGTMHMCLEGLMKGCRSSNPPN